MKDMHKDIPEENNEPMDREEKLAEENVKPLTDLEAQLADAEEMVKKHQDNYLRALAEMENMRKRNLREREEYIKFASLPILKKLLNIMDDFERALNNTENQDFEALHKGVEMIYKKLLEIVTAEGVAPIEALGQPFDPEFHHPLLMEESSEPENTVIEELQKGYIMHGRVVRPSLVKVSN